MKNMFQRFISGAAALLIVVSLTSCATKPKWYKGNTHTHTFWSDGKGFPETAADTYKQMGYHFLALSDHNVVSRGERWVNFSEKRMGAAVARTEARWGEDHLGIREVEGKRQIRLMPLAEVRELVEERGRFIMIEGVELTSAVREGKQVHSNPINISRPLTVNRKSQNTVEQELALHEHLVHEHINEVDHPIFWHINHPNWKKSITGEQLAAVKGAHGVEIMNASGGCLNEGNGSDLPPMEHVWDVANTLRLKEGVPPLFGCATDDTHQYHYEEPHLDGPGLAWIMVRSVELTPDAITAAMLNGEFYSSTGVMLKTVAFDENARTFTVEITSEPNVNYTISFVGSTPDETGKVFETLEGTKAVYKMNGDELFVRAVVRCDAPAVCAYDEFSQIRSKAWTQPVGWK